MAERTLTRADSPKGKEDMAQHTETQLVGLLSPFADRVLCIEHSIQVLLNRVENGDTTAAGHAARLTDTGAWSQQIKSDIASMKAHQVAMQNNLSVISQEKAVLEQDRDEAKAKSNDANDQLQDMARLLQEQQLSLNSTIARVDQLFTEMRETNDSLKTHLEGTFKQDIEDIANKHEQNAHDLEQTKTQLKSTILSLDETKKACAKTKREDDKTFATLTSDITRMKASLIDTDSRTSKQGERLELNVAQVKTVQGNLDVLTTEKVALHSQSDRLTNQVLNLQVRFVPVEKGLAGLLDAANRPVKTVKNGKGDKGEQKEHGRRNVAEYLADIEDMLNANNKRIDELTATNVAQDKETMQKVDGLHKEIVEIDSKVKNADNEVKNLHNLHSNAVSMIDSSVGVHGELRDSINASAKRIDSIDGDVQLLTKRESESRDTMTKLGMSVGLCNEHFSGLRKGFRDASSRVVGREDALLPETAHSRAMTPNLPNMRGLKSPSPAMMSTPRNNQLRCHSAMGTAHTGASTAWTSPAFASSGFASPGLAS